MSEHGSREVSRGFVSLELQLLMVSFGLISGGIGLAVIEGLAADAFWDGVAASATTSGVALGAGVLLLGLVYGPAALAGLRRLRRRRREPG